MLRKFRHPMKNKDIRIYYEEDYETGYIKQYIVPEGKVIKAYVRQLSANEQFSADASQDGGEYEFTVMKREIKRDMYLEFDNGFGLQTLQIGAIDMLEFYNSEITFRARNIIPREEYIEVRWA